MRNTVVFKVNTPATAGAGFTDSYATLLTTRGYLTSVGQRRELSYGESAASSSHILFVRYQALIKDNLRSDMKIVVDGLTYTMNGLPALVDERQQYYKFFLQCQQP